jgi:hypothetical protein
VDEESGRGSHYARLNGAAVEIFWAKSPRFSYTVPDENRLYAYIGEFGPQFDGTIKPAVADGYWAYIPPLAPGAYVVKFGAADT